MSINKCIRNRIEKGNAADIKKRKEKMELREREKSRVRLKISGGD